MIRKNLMDSIRKKLYKSAVLSLGILLLLNSTLPAYAKETAEDLANIRKNLPIQSNSYEN